MLIETLGKLTTRGDVSVTDSTVIARPQKDNRSEAMFLQSVYNGIQKYRYSFKIQGEFSDFTTIVLQFHDWWSIPDNIKVGNKDKLYLAKPPPVAFAVKNNNLVFLNNQLTAPVTSLDMEKEHLVTSENNYTAHQMFPIQLDEWIDLDIEINWSKNADGWVKCNEFEVQNIKTMFNDNPTNIQFGLYLDTKLTSNEIREMALL